MDKMDMLWSEERLQKIFSKVIIKVIVKITNIFTYNIR